MTIPATSQLSTFANNQLRLARTGGIQTVKANLRQIEQEYNPVLAAQIAAILAQVWGQTVIFGKGFAPIVDPRADQKIVEDANAFLSLLAVNEIADARKLIADHAEPMFVAVVLLIAAV